ncbi:MAG: 2,3-diphosphoglycerate-dependent phosphoglycerate mutase [Fusobacteriales bacterium]|jgi:2,3-bisphosphoglycerate-dependent phosphoglycerate mutase|nr:2,3-diphosphoglycerate-dependent phosphoglycerate mutase [Fusobacteriales bacterium]
MYLVFIRHGRSEWNRKNLFTGWTDVDLSDEGINEAVKAGQLLKKHNFTFDAAYTSVLKRAIQTLYFVLNETDQLWIPVCKSWRLNERHYGALQGLNKVRTAEKYGDEQVHIWRRSYDILPPLLDENDERQSKFDRRYKGLDSRILPSGENLKATLERVMPYWEDEIAPALKSGKKVVIAAHGNSLRALAKYLENINDDEIMNLEIPTGVPLIYELNDDFKVLKKYYLED